MSCCSGDTQTRKMSVIIKFRPSINQEFQLKFQLKGRNGKWNGRGSGTYDFGSELSCGVRPLTGEQEVSMKMELLCNENDGNLTISGFIDLKFDKTNTRFTLIPTVLDCPRGGPGCLAEWPIIFFNHFLGNGSLTVRGVAA